MQFQLNATPLPRGRGRGLYCQRQWKTQCYPISFRSNRYLLHNMYKDDRKKQDKHWIAAAVLGVQSTVATLTMGEHVCHLTQSYASDRPTQFKRACGSVNFR
jgi:hypothetical protein